MPVDVSELQSSLIDWLDAGCEEAMRDLAQQAEDRASRRDGELIDSREETVLSTAASGSWEGSVAFTAEHASYQDEGTGIYGPEGDRIEGNPILAFYWPAAGGMVFVHSVAGSEPTRFFSFVFDDESNWSDALDRNLGDLA